MNQEELLEIIDAAATNNAPTLNLSNKGITSLPPEIGRLTNLKRLDLYNNQLTSFPPEVGRLKNLTYLSLSRNRLTTLPPEIGQLTNLQELHLLVNQLTTVPPEIGKLTNLNSLDLGGNQLTSVPEALGNLTNLTTLGLQGNRLTSLPPEIGKLTNLTELHLFGNQLTSVPEALGNLKNLTHLWLFDNHLTTVPAEIGRCENLKELYLHRNRLTTLPPEIGRLTNLTYLSLHGNQLTSLPAKIGQCGKLEVLYLYSNRLATVPAEIGRLKNLTILTLGGNPDLTSPPPEVVKQGTNAILSYLRELSKGAKERYEGKLLILGDGKQGKTCVQRALRRLEFKQEIRTEGVEVYPWEFAHPDYTEDLGKRITLKIWDFEGQEINHQSHQFFLTAQALYLLVINGRQPFKKERAEYWLDTIRSRAPDSRVILVASECENTTPSWPLDRLKQEYGDLLQGNNWYFSVGCENRKAIDDLEREIRAASVDMEQMGKEWPATYQRAEEAIVARRDKDASVSKSELYQILRDSEIDEDGLANAARDMARLGVITQFEDTPALEDFVVLNPQWLTKGISLVMEDKQLDEDKGEITHERMKQIWDSGYAGLYPTLHSCMKEFELLYDMEDMPGCLVPLRFGDVRPDIPWSDIPDGKDRRIEYKMTIHPPKGIMSRFIVKTHHMIAKTEKMPKGVYWDKGVFLRTGEGRYRSEALCEFIEEDRTLRITVRAAFPQNMIEQLHAFAKAVFSFFDGLKPERKYGCMKLEEAKKEEDCAGAHAERRILFALSKERTIDCEVGWHEVDPKRLVYGFSSFGEAALTVKELREQWEKKPAWAKGLAGDVMSSLVWIDKIYNEVVANRREQKQLSAQARQEVELKLRDHIGLMNEMLDNRDFNSAPAVVSIVPVDGSKFNPKNWFEKEYELMPYCEYEGGVHPADFSVRFRKPKEWWLRTAPKLSLAVKVFSAGVQIACAGLPLALKPEVFAAVENHAEFMKELAGHLELEGGAESDISGEAGQLVEGLKGKGTVRDLRQFGGEDEKRIVRMQLAELLGEIAPKEYKARQWGPLRRVRMPDNTYRWLCEKDAAEYRK